MLHLCFYPLQTRMNPKEIRLCLRHAAWESGEERFTVAWHEDDAVWYDILAFSRPNHFLARLGYPLVRRLQKRFARDSAAAMKRAVRSGEPS